MKNWNMFLEKYFLGLIAYIAAYMSPVNEFIFATGLLVAADTILGVSAAFKNDEPITSKKLARSILKFLSYGAALIVALVIQRHFLRDFPSVQVIGGLIAFIEVKSIDEKLHKLTGYSFFEFLINKLKSNNK